MPHFQCFEMPHFKDSKPLKVGHFEEKARDLFSKQEMKSFGCFRGISWYPHKNVFNTIPLFFSGNSTVELTKDQVQSSPPETQPFR